MAQSLAIRKTRTRLRRFRGRYREVARHARLKYSWLSKFACGEIGERPSFEFMQRLLLTLDEFEAEGSAPLARTAARRKR